MVNFVRVLEHVESQVIFELTLEVLVDDKDHNWLIDITTMLADNKPKLSALMSISEKSKSERRDSKGKKVICDSKAYCDYKIDVIDTIEDNDDLLNYNKKDLLLGWINLESEDSQKSHEFTYKSILLEQIERETYLDEVYYPEHPELKKTKGKGYKKVNLMGLKDPLLIEERKYMTIP